MTHAQWVATREPDAPPALVDRVRGLLEEHAEWSALALPEALIAAGDVLLGNVLEGDCALRASALDLLAADACVTWAFEAAADEPATIGDRAEAVQRRINEAVRPHLDPAL